MPQPELKQFLDLTESDFERHPIWMGCHVADYDKPWYDQTDEETFRPYEGVLPADADERLLVKATATTHAGEILSGFLSPAEQPSDLGRLQPHVFLDGAPFGFWVGMVAVSEEERRRLLDSLGGDAARVFPIYFRADPSLATGVVEAVVND